MESGSGPVWCKVCKGIQHVKAGFEWLDPVEFCHYLGARRRLLNPHSDVPIQGHATRIVTQAKSLTHLWRPSLQVSLL
jgi:hypothetical protein